LRRQGKSRPIVFTPIVLALRFAVLGIQMMLGATRPTIFKSVMTRGLGQIALGLLSGLALAMPAAWTFARLFKNGWMRINTFDLSVYGVAALILLTVSLAAMCLPAMRAMRVDPIEALRNE